MKTLVSIIASLFFSNAAIADNPNNTITIHNNIDSKFLIRTTGSGGMPCELGFGSQKTIWQNSSIDIWQNIEYSMQKMGRCVSRVFIFADPGQRQRPIGIFDVSIGFSEQARLNEFTTFTCEKLSYKDTYFCYRVNSDSVGFKVTVTHRDININARFS